MLILHHQSNNPYFNIASEEYLLKNFTNDFFILYRNNPSIIVGKHQNTLAEINLDFVRNNGISVIRRLSGGGTVYHDLGNLNYTFIANGSKGNLVDFKKFTQPIIDLLHSYGIEAFLGGKNDIRVGDKKISGNAEHVYKDRVLHHGTLLYSSNLEFLNESILVDPKKYSDKAVKSIRSTVANISEFIGKPLGIDQFITELKNHILATFKNSKEYCLATHDIDQIENLIKSKYSTWEWNFGYSPTYTLKRKISIGKNDITLVIQVDKGIIIDVDFSGNTDRNMELVKTLLVQCPHDYSEVEKRFKTLPKDTYDSIHAKDLIKEIF